MNYDRLESEASIEKKLIQTLVDLGYKDRSQDIKTIDDINKNIKFHIERLNKSGPGSLEGNPLDLEKFETYILKKIYKNSIYKNGMQIRDLFEIPNEQHTNSTFRLKLFDFNNLENNCFEVSNQIEHKSNIPYSKNRSDVTIFINGVPIVQIELKRNDVEVNQAFKQIQRYKKESFDIESPYKLIQIFIITNKTIVKYFANTDNLNNKFCFNWTDDKNEQLNNLSEVANSMLNKKTLFDLVFEFMIFGKEDEEEKIFILRPYQYYAVQNIMNHIKKVESKNDILTNLDERSKQLNGYVWHATGSGKTLTSFKVAQLLANKKYSNFEKVIFLVDRLDLNAQTIDNFNNILNPGNYSNSIDTVENTDKLQEQFLDSTKKIIVTTIHKINKLITRNNHEFANKYNKQLEKNYVFIIDECHRTQSGKMHKEIRKAFKKSIFIGFTGTPIFDTSENNNATSKMFGECLHHYKMYNAINDNNVLPFHIEYVKGPVRNDINKEFEVSNDIAYDIDTKELFSSDKYIEKITDYIYEINKDKTVNKTFKSMLVCSSIDIACKYYDMFRKKHPDLKVAALFSEKSNDEIVSKNEEKDNVFFKETLKKVIDGYNQDFGNKKYTVLDFKKYSRDIQNNLKKPSGLIDLVIVVKMLTTGFDAKPINTIYLDRKLENHELIQTISRANRLFASKGKIIANVVCFRTFAKDVDKAIALYNDENSLNIIAPKSDLKKLINELNNLINEVESKWKTSQEIKNEISEINKKDFVQKMRAINKIYLQIKSFIEFEHNVENVKWSLETLHEYRNVQIEIANSLKREPNKESILNDIDFELEIIRVDEVNVDYIFKILSEVSNIDNKEKYISKLDDMIQKHIKKHPTLKDEMIEKFLKYWRNKMNNNYEQMIKEISKEEIYKEYNKHTFDNIKIKIDNFAKECNLNSNKIEELIKMQRIQKKSIDKYTDFIEDEVILNDNLSFDEKGNISIRVMNFIDDLDLENIFI